MLRPGVLLLMLPMIFRRTRCPPNKVRGFLRGHDLNMPERLQLYPEKVESHLEPYGLLVDGTPGFPECK
jgi:hypothetical protein